MYEIVRWYKNNIHGGGVIPNIVVIVTSILHGNNEILPTTFRGVSSEIVQKIEIEIESPTTCVPQRRLERQADALQIELFGKTMCGCDSVYNFYG